MLDTTARRREYPYLASASALELAYDRHTRNPAFHSPPSRRLPSSYVRKQRGRNYNWPTRPGLWLTVQIPPAKLRIGPPREQYTAGILFSSLSPKIGIASETAALLAKTCLNVGSSWIQGGKLTQNHVARSRRLPRVYQITPASVTQLSHLEQAMV